MKEEPKKTWRFGIKNKEDNENINEQNKIQENKLNNIESQKVEEKKLMIIMPMIVIQFIVLYRVKNMTQKFLLCLM